MPTPTHELYQFGAFRLEAAERRFFRDGKIVPLAPKVFDTLVLLLDRAGHLVTKDQLMEALWPDMVVEEANLTKNIWLIRKVLGEEAGAPFIETVPKIGYRWVAPVRCGAAPKSSPPPPVLIDAPAPAPLPASALPEAGPMPAHRPEHGEESTGADCDVPVVAITPSPAASVEESASAVLRDRDPAPRSRRAVVATTAVFVAGAALVAVWIFPRRPSMERPSAPAAAASAASAAAAASVLPVRPSVAILGFHDLSRRPSSAWLSTALAEMVGSELAAGERVRLVAAEEVVRQDVRAPAGMLAAETLGRLRRNLHADFVVRGAFATIPGSAGSGDRLRLDVVIQDARTGDAAGTVSATGMENDLFQIVSSLGVELRGKLGLAAATPAEQASVAVSLPRSPEAARLYAEGLDRLRRLDAQEARALLARAEALEPDHPLIHDALSRAWSALGYDEKSRQEAQRAQDLSGNLPRENRLAIEARLAAATKNWDRAIDIERTLFGFFPDRLDYGLKLAGDQTSGGKAKDALATIARLAQLPPPDRDDPRIDLAEARAAGALSDHKRKLAAATRAAEKAATEGRNGILARARNEQAGALEDLGDTTGAAARREDVARLFEADGDINGAATARIGLGTVVMGSGDLTRAAALFGQARDAFQSVGNKAGLATAYSDLCLVEWLQGRVEEARAHARQVIDLRRETHDRSGTAWALTVLGNFMVEDGNFAQAYGYENEALGISREIGDRSYAAFCLDALGGAYEAEGRLDDAEKSFRDSLAISQQLEDPTAISGETSDLGNVAMDRGDVEAADRSYVRALDLRVKAGDEVGAAETRMQLAQLRHRQGRYAEALTLASEAANAFEKQKQPGNLAISRATMARAEAALGRRDEARKDVAKARELVSTSRQNGAVLPVLLAASRIGRISGDSAGARALASEARRRAERVKWRAFIFEARLVEAELDLSPVRRPSAVAALSTLAREARAAGFGSVAREAEAAMNGTIAP